MKKIFLVLILVLSIISCEDKMAGTKVNEYTPTDANPENMQETMDTQRRGFMALSLSNFDNTSAAQIESGSSVEISGSLYEFTSDESIVTTDPVTSSTVADGSIYLVLITSGSSVTAAWTASAPTWDSDKQGYYLTISGTARRVVGGCVLSGTTTVFSEKYIYNGQGLYSVSKGEYTEKLSSEYSTTATTLNIVTSTFTTSIDVVAGDVYKFVLFSEWKATSTGVNHYYLKTSGTSSSLMNGANSGSSTYVDMPAASTSYLKYCESGEIFVYSSGTLKIDEYIYLNAGQTGYIKNRVIYLKKINTIQSEY